MEWLALIVPAIMAIYLWRKYPEKVVWWELLLPIVASLLCIVVLRYVAHTAMTWDTEYWTGYAVQSEFHEEWVERVEEEKEDSNGKKYTVVSYRTHPEEYWVEDNNGQRVSVNRQVYNNLRGRWSNSKRHTPFRMNAHRNGDIHTSSWDQKRESMEIVTTTHRYENRITASDNILKYPQVEKEAVKGYGLYQYPSVSGYYHCPAILGGFGPDAAKAERLLSEYNALLGKSKQVRMWILVFVDQPRDAGFQQEALWQNGNKNELVVCVGVDKAGEVQWSHVFSWTDVQELKIVVRDQVEEQKKLDLVKTVEDMRTQVEKSWVRKQFRDFDYIDVPLPGWMILIIWVVSIGGAVGVAVWCVKNEHTEGGLRSRFSFRRLR